MLNKKKIFRSLLFNIYNNSVKKFNLKKYNSYWIKFDLSKEELESKKAIDYSGRQLTAGVYSFHNITFKISTTYVDDVIDYIGFIEEEFKNKKSSKKIVMFLAYLRSKELL